MGSTKFTLLGKNKLKGRTALENAAGLYILLMVIKRVWCRRMAKSNVVIPNNPMIMDMDPESPTRVMKPISDSEQPSRASKSSFGLELEFLIAVSMDGLTDPDLEVRNILPPISHGAGYKVKSAIARCLMELGIPVYDYEDHGLKDEGGCLLLPELFDALAQEASQREIDSWTVTTDSSVMEAQTTGYTWTPIEITSPACYAIEEAFEMIRLVVHLITSNFRCRVNHTCGFHVHLGNGRSRLGLHAARNFSALWWAAEPILTMLHPPERALARYAMSTRRTGMSALAAHATADDARRACLAPVDVRSVSGYVGNTPDVPLRARYYGRERLMGERPEPENLPYREPAPGEFTWAIETSRLPLGWEDEDDDVDWKADNTQPFRRPKKEPRCRRHATQSHNPPSGQKGLSGPETRVQLPSSCIASNVSRNAENSCEPEAWERDSDNYCTRRLHSLRTTPDDDLRLPRPRTPPLGREQNNRYYEARSVEIMDREDVKARRLPYDQAPEDYRPWRHDFWSGIKEIFSCDLGVHQLACLQSSEEGRTRHTSKFMNLNWSAYMPANLSMNLLPAAGPTARSWGDRGPYGRTGFLTLENREALGTLDADWIVTWARVLCGLLDWCRRASPSEVLRIVGLCEDPRRYDVVDLLHDVGLYAEAVYCEQRLQRGPEAWFDCIVLGMEHQLDGE